MKYLLLLLLLSSCDIAGKLSYDVEIDIRTPPCYECRNEATP